MPAQTNKTTSARKLMDAETGDFFCIRTLDEPAVYVHRGCVSMLLCPSNRLCHASTLASLSADTATLQAPIRELATRQCLGAGVGRGEDGVGTGVMWGGGVGRDTAVGRGEGGGGTGVM